MREKKIHPVDLLNSPVFTVNTGGGGGGGSLASLESKLFLCNSIRGPGYLP